MVDLKAEGEKIEALAASEAKTIAGMPRWRIGVYAALLLFGIVYLVWCHFQKPVPTTAFVAAPPAVKTAKVAGPVMTVPLRVVPKKAVIATFPELASQVEAPQTEVIDTAEIPKTDNGVKVVTFMNVSTGVASTVYKANPAPWFAFEKGNTVGATYLQTTAGPTAAVYYKRDLFRVKDFHMGLVAGAGESGGKAVAAGGLVGEVKW